MNNNFEEPMINVYVFNSHDVVTTLSEGYEQGGHGVVGGATIQEYNGGYNTVTGGLDENIPL